MLFTTTPSGEVTVEVFWTDSEHVGVFGTTLGIFVGLVYKVWSASRPNCGVGERGSASRKNFWVPDSDHAECVSGAFLIILHVPMCSPGRGFTLFHSGEDIDFF